MKGTPFQKLILMMTLAAIAAALVLQFINSRLTPQSPPEPPVVKAAESEAGFAYNPPRTRASAAAGSTSDDGADEFTEPKIPRDKAEAWLAKHRRNAASLLAVFRALGDTNYLNEAATNFPGDPQVQLAVLSRNVYPEDRRKWLEAFKASSPDNSLANYLSAADYFKSGKTEEALQEIMSASGKEQFQNYAMDTLLNSEELFADAGTDPRMTASYALGGMTEENLPQLAMFKEVARGLSEVMKQKNAAGDVGATLELARLGLDFSEKLNSGDSGKFVINHLVGIASETVVLSQMDQNTPYDFLNGQTPAQAAEALKQQKVERRKLLKDHSGALMQMMQSESETAAYAQRMKIYGEIEAMKWLVQRHPPTDSTK